MDYGTVVFTTAKGIVIDCDFSDAEELEDVIRHFQADHELEDYYLSIYPGHGYLMGQEPTITKKITNT